MDNTVSLNHLITQYQTLCQYCDEFFTRTYETFRSHMRCAKGCASCCMLETVAPLEAFMISEYLKSLSDFTLPPPSVESGEIPCVFLHDDVCTIYPARPIICRTHGLPLIYPNQQEMEVCQLNFAEVEITTIDPQYLLDAESITENLMRFNLAFCMLTETPDRAEVRIPLYQIPKILKEDITDG